METPIPTNTFGAETVEAGLIKETTTADFTKDVIDASKNSLILLDLWAPWCGPCKQLTPILEKVVNRANGAVRLVKMNIDEHPAIASQLGVQSIPAVFAFKDGRPVDGFMGALSESEVKAFVERLAGPQADGGMEEVLQTARECLEDGNYQDAAEVFGAILGEEPAHVEAIAGLAKCFIAVGELDKAEHILSTAPEAASSDNEIKAAEAALALARKGSGTNVDISSFKARLDADPNDHQARFDMSIALNGAGDKEQALNALFEIIQRNKAWNDNAAQAQLLEFFAAWGPSDESTIEGRRRLSSILFA